MEGVIDENLFHSFLLTILKGYSPDGLFCL